MAKPYMPEYHITLDTFMKPHPAPFAFILCISLLAAGSRAVSQTDSTSRIFGGKTGMEKLLFVGALNFDCYPDSVHGVASSSHRGYLPTRIVWGRPEKDSHDEQDSACLRDTPREKRRHQTVITYPGWNIRGGGVAFQNLNADSLTDIVIHIRGKIKRKDDKPLDTLRSLALFGQQGLDSLPVIALGSIGRFQATPFFAMDLVIGSEMNKPGRRDLTGRTSYVLEPVLLDIGDRERDSSQGMPAGPLSGVHTEDGAMIRVFPNPAGDVLTVEARGLKPGNYKVHVISVNGETAMQHTLKDPYNSDMHALLDVSRLASGHYVVRVENDSSRVIGIWPVVIIR